MPTAYHVPVKNAKITSKFGWRNAFAGIPAHQHNGTDLIPLKGDFNIYAPADSVVTFAQFWGGAGNFIKLKAGNVEFEFMHLKSMNVKVGDNVKKGQIIGVMGTTGLSTGVHLHFGVIQNGKYIDPEKFMNLV